MRWIFSLLSFIGLILISSLCWAEPDYSNASHWATFFYNDNATACSLPKSASPQAFTTITTKIDFLDFLYKMND